MKYPENEYEETKEQKYFPNIIENEKHEGINHPIVESVPHKLPDLSNKYRKLLKDSSSDEFENKPRSPFNQGDVHAESDKRILPMRDCDPDKHDNYGKNFIKETIFHYSSYIFLLTRPFI